MLNQNLLLKFLALLLSCFIWVQTALLKEQETIVKIPMTIINLPAEAATPKLPAYIKYKVKGMGFEIAKIRLFHVQAVLDAKRLPKGIFKLSDLNYMLNIPASVHVEMLGVVDESISSGQSSHQLLATLPIQVNFTNEKTRAMYYEKDFSVNPEKVSVRGSEAALNRIHFIQTQPVNETMLSRNKFRLQLLNPNPDIALSDDTVEVKSVSRQQVTKILRMLPIEPIAGYNIFPQSISIRIRGQQDDIKNLKNEQIIIKPRISEVSEGQVKLHITVPEGIELLDYTPQKVEYSKQ
jgi:YbbR domain-containing protein